MPTPEQIDRDEHTRVLRLREKARARPHLTAYRGTAGTEAQSSAQRARYENQKGFNLPRKILGYSNAVVLGDAIRKQIIRTEYAKAHAADGLIVHVKDGKPLTAEGAKMLGVSWP